MRLRLAFGGLDTGYPAVAIMCGLASRQPQSGVRLRPSLFSTVTMYDSLARVSGWQQLYHLWELIVMLCKFLWSLLRFLGGGG
ncbi:hypothetical protein CUJ87_09195 [Paraburkholderia caledonica]|jgi:hypothetical protein|nr:hypothetical protein CUJ87_09195 [Paraburkholderia caledonica]